MKSTKNLFLLAIALLCSVGINAQRVIKVEAEGVAQKDSMVIDQSKYIVNYKFQYA